MSGSVAGAEMMTFFAPASRCFCAPSRLVKKPVDSITTSTPRSPHGSAAGSRSASPFSSWPAALIEPASTATSPGERAEQRVVREQVRHRRHVAEVVERDELEVGVALQRRAEEVAADAAEAVDAHACLRHGRRTLARPRKNGRVNRRSRRLCDLGRVSETSQRRLRDSDNSSPGDRTGAASRDGQAVDRADLRAQVAHVRLRVDRLRADRALERLGRRELAAVAVQVLAQPLAQRAELAALELLVRGRGCRRGSAPRAAPRSGSRARRSGSSRASRSPSACPGARRACRRAPRRRGSPTSAGSTPRAAARAGTTPRACSCSSSKRRMMWRL